MFRHAQEEIAEREGVHKDTVSEICRNMAVLPKSDKPAADHLVDFEEIAEREGISNMEESRFCNEMAVLPRSYKSTAGLISGLSAVEVLLMETRLMRGNLKKNILF